MVADGSITIDSRIDQAGFNAGIKTMTTSFGKVLNVVKGIGKALAAAFIGGSIIAALRGLVGSFDIMKSSVADKFKPLSDALSTLKGAFINLLVTAIMPLIPFIVQAVQWFTNLLFTVTQLIGALFGVKKTMGGIAAETKKTTKETKGALAAFDQINVLQTQQPEEGGPAALVTPEALDISQEFLDWADKFKEKLQELKDFFMRLWTDPIGTLKQLWSDIVAWFRENVFTPLAEWWKNTWLGDFISRIWENFKATWSAIVENTRASIQAIKENLMLVLQGIGEFLRGVFTGDWALAWQGIKDIVTGILGAIWAAVTGAFNNIVIYIRGVINFLKIVFEPIREAIGIALEWIKEKFITVFGSIKDTIKGIINNIIDFINRMIEAVIGGINSVINAANTVATLIPGVPAIANVNAPQIPRLATGAVIPPNAAFAAVLGDQRSGKNLEAPESLIRQIMREELGSINANISIGFTGSMADLVRQLKPHIDKEDIRVGGSLIKGVRR